MPNHFFDLLSDDRTNREVLTWLKTWDPIVHGSSVSKPKGFKSSY